ncbi:hypothetical protein A3K48_02045 [candidate division WOR-1 bacterium RIFOXYA12_FULL_52_29]|uniref:Uncharacterized protein n=1 Tax=candidate division WOR-1 bacterium RIFOXYC12_FULL_54_18 TaxID=1802584 RepID=A0A1F4T4Z1_UNCSA|nr:MAG: hypothetical protein A3K44_02045 [candidate division WOR-1 bacterium RIFOXYA2_FULL_51_19]OGC17361.1 MAG: hypothetical protein A3K48_02045 [candidate division WOR-1 bacterium RIFOXYA12_FULL_52_29]OGC26220.1 MAG: hypothetical protein A3K32_02040 [candidate division WOR-1 bacterium RIFOXYB2_FULL_45_9]OGC27778.1 MAG: hypothetical protein A3K49_02045 [candidate division WOR-1 bacterium RIFOXYC12_FULL_54_18]OGC29933.1 MAG: hypothetical protein A2346_04290 [candidate division WOR-1 bacterium R
MAEQNIDIDSIGKIDINKITMKDDYGALKFQKSAEYLIRLQGLFGEFAELQYKTILSKPEIDDIDNKKTRFVDYIKRIDSFNLNHPNPKPLHDQLEGEIERYSNETIQQTKTNLVYLRQEAALKSKDEEELQKQQKAAVQAEIVYKELALKLQNELENLKQKKAEIETTHGEIASVTLAKYFEKQANEDRASMEKWLGNRDKTFWFLIGLIAFNFIVYFGILMMKSIGIIVFGPESFFTLEYGLAKLALLSVVSYGLGFASKNYNVYANMYAINTHRRNVAQTLQDYIATNPEPEAKSEMIKEGTEAMFKHMPIGYIGRLEGKDTNAVYEVINNYIKQRP